MATSAAVGACALAFGGAALPAAAEDSSEVGTLTAVADKYEVAAASTASSITEVKKAEERGDLLISDRGSVVEVDKAFEGSALSTLALPSAPEAAAVPGSPAGGSRPGAPVTVYLDFDGETLTGVEWNDIAERDSLAFVGQAKAGAAYQQQVWSAVAEDYAPFNVNVTTTRPSDDKLYKTSVDDNEYGSHVIITDSYDEVLPDAAGSSGLAFVGGTGSTYATGALVFTVGTTADGDPASATAKDVADTATHESGHNFGLSHDSIEGESSGYYTPTEGVWGPIMGSTYYVPVTQWSNGDYAGAESEQKNPDDLAVITDRGAAGYTFLYATLNGAPYEGTQVCVISGDPSNPAPGDQFQAVVNGDCGDLLELHFEYFDRADFAADQVGNDAAGATALTNDGTFEAAGVIERRTDVDVFSVVTAGGPFTATVEVADFSPNLDTKLTLTDASGAVIAENDAATTRTSIEVAAGLGATVTADVEPGVYYLAVDGVGSGDPKKATPQNSGGYSDYASLGNYALSGEAAEFVTEPIVIDSPADGEEVVGGEDLDVTGSATPNATVTLTVGGATVTAEADASGAWAATVTPNEYGNTEIVASQKVASIDIPGTDSVTVTAPVDAPVIKAPADESSSENPTPAVSGTGIAGATVTVTVSNGAGVSVTASAVVDADGNWALTLGQLPAGTYTIEATQAINGVTSDGAEAVSFTITAAPTPTPTPTATGGTSTGTDGDLATTGGDMGGVTISLLVAGVLLAAGASVAFGARARRKVTLES
jgi:hypothetical protein